MNMVNNFNKASKYYDSVATVQKQSAAVLIEHITKMNIHYPKTILDLGTGTGYIPQMLMLHYPQSSYYLNDIAEGMIDICKLKFANRNNVYFNNTDMEHLENYNYDLIVSNFALQWAKGLHILIKKCYNHSNIFGFTTLTSGTFHQWSKLLNKYNIDNVLAIKYPTLVELVDFCNNIKHPKDDFNYFTQEFSIEFKNVMDFMKYIKKLGANNNNILDIKSMRSIIRDKSSLVITYCVFFGIFINNSKNSIN